MAIFMLILGIAVLYLIEVALGSSVSQYDSEVGLPSRLQEPKALSRQEFFGNVLPIILLGLGIPLFFVRPDWGFLSISVAAILFVGKKVCKSVISQ